MVVMALSQLQQTRRKRSTAKETEGKEEITKGKEAQFIFSLSTFSKASCRKDGDLRLQFRHFK